MRQSRRTIHIALAALLVAAAPALRAQPKTEGDNAELTRMCQEDQDDRKPGPHGIDWSVVKPRDDARLARTRALYASGALHTGADWFHAALILQHADEAEDYLLAHEMSIAAVALGYRNARWLVAAAEDRFLRKIGRNQRFGTQYEPSPDSGNYRLGAVEDGVTDELRAALGTSSLAEAKARAKQFDRK